MLYYFTSAYVTTLNSMTSPLTISNEHKTIKYQCRFKYVGVG